MTNPNGPRLISHMADEETPTLDPRLQVTANALRELKAKKAQLEYMRVRMRRGEVNAAEFASALRDGFNAYAVFMAQLPTAQAQTQAFVRDLPKELRRTRLEYIETSRDDPDAGVLEAVDARRGYFRAEMVDGNWNALQRRPDDCLQAAIATHLQCPAADVPDLKLGELVGKDPEEQARVIGLRMGTWLEKNAISIRTHSDTNLPRRSSRWIGVVDAESDGNSHCVILQGSEVIADSAWLLPPRRNEMLLSWHSLDDVSLGLTIEMR